MSQPGPTSGRRLDYFDPFMGDERMRRAYRNLVEGDWRSLEKYLDTSPVSWMFASAVTGETVGVETITFERWVDYSNSPRARTLLAAANIRDAYSRRRRFEQAVAASSEPPPRSDVDGTIAVFEKALQDAENQLFAIIGSNVTYPDPWVFLLQTGRGLAVDLEELRQRFDNAHSRVPFRPDACREYLECLTDKWGGSLEASMDFARWVEDQAPPDAPARAALPIAHIECGLAQGGGAALAEYLNNDEVVVDLIPALSSFLRATGSTARTEELPVLNTYALALSADSPETASLLTEVFERIDDRPTEYPWNLYQEQVPEVFREIRNDQLRFASRY